MILCYVELRVGGHLPQLIVVEGKRKEQATTRRSRRGNGQVGRVSVYNAKSHKKVLREMRQSGPTTTSGGRRQVNNM